MEKEKIMQVIHFSPITEKSGEKIIKSKKIENTSEPNKIENSDQKYRYFKIVLLLIGVFLVIGATIATIIILTRKKKIDDITIDTSKEEEGEKEQSRHYIIPEYLKINGPIEMQTEYKIKTDINDLKRIYINQKYYEDIKIDGVLSQNIVDRKTVYDFYIIRKINATDEEKYFDNFTYECSIAISSECISSKTEYCVPSKLVDLNDQDNSNSQEIDNLDDFPIPLCYFNITDNNVITSIACHKKIKESKIKSIILDLYFFRPPGIKRINKEKNNITIGTTKIDDIEIIRETNRGICDIDNPKGSICMTDLNTTKNSKGEFLNYSEIASTNITKNKDNYFIKNKNTILIDMTNNISQLNPEKYNETVYKLYSVLKDYLKYYEQFSLENFKELYNVSKGLPNEEQKRRRRLTESQSVIVDKKNLFTFEDPKGVIIKIMLKDNVGYNNEAMEASNFLQIDDEPYDLANIKQFTDIDKIIKKIINLSKAGNNLATILYNKIKENLNNITNIINLNIPSMSSLLAYKELSDIFDSTFSIKTLKVVPYNIIEESNNLKNKLEEIYNKINNGNLKQRFEILNNYTYHFIIKSHMLVNNLSDNLNELGKLLKSPKQTISYISCYYMNHTTTSFINTIKEAQDILMNYFENEKDLIVPQVKEILEKFENVTIESLEKQINLINNLNKKLDDNELKIDNSNNDEDYKTIISNLHNSNTYLGNIIKLFKNKVENELYLEDGYFISQYEIISNNETFTRIINEAMNISYMLDDNKYIDKLFDEIMLNFTQTFINITKYMEDLRDENFVPYENVLKGSYFSIQKQQNISHELKDFGKEIIIKIKKENNLYLDTVKEVINEFLENNRDYLYQLMTEINIIFSTDSLNTLSKSYEMAINRHFNKIKNDIENNKNLTEEYFDGMVWLMNNDSLVEQLLKDINETTSLLTEKEHQQAKFCNTTNADPEHCWNRTYVDDSNIKNRKYGGYYLSKYQKFKENLEISKIFIKSDMKSNILNEYKSVITKLKLILQSFKNNKMSEKYPYYTDLYFIDNHIKDINELNNRLNRYLSDDIFNNNYLPKIQEYIINETKETDNIETYIENQHEKIINVTNEGTDRDFCTSYMRKRTYTCTNGLVYSEDHDRDSCLYSWGSNNYANMTRLSFNNDEIFEEEFNNFYSLIKYKIDIYNNLISELKQNITLIETQILDKNIINNYLSPIEDYINLIISELYSNNLIKGSYEYHKNIIEQRLEEILITTSDKWIDSFENLRKNVTQNLRNFKYYSMNEFGSKASIYKSIITDNLTRIYYDSIIKNQKLEHNYTISYYYNCLLQNITSIYQYIFNQIPTNQEGFNNIVNLRRKEIENKFIQLLKIVNDSKYDSLSNNRQIYVLQVSSSNFFKTDSFLSNISKATYNSLNSIVEKIMKLNNRKSNNQFSLACRFYLENSLNGYLIEEYYKPINDNDSLFIYLNLNKFIELFSDNWIFEQDDIINQLNILIINSNLEIENDFSIKKEEYLVQLENEIIKFGYSKENISDKIAGVYKNIKDIDEEKKNTSIKYIHEILDVIKNHLINERERMVNYAVSYTNNFSKINDTLNIYKEIIYDKLDKIILKIVDDLYEKLNIQGYKNLIEPGLNIYLKKAEDYISECKNYETLNSSFNIGEFIYNSVKDLVGNYKNFTEMQLEYSYQETIKELKKQIGMEKIKKLIDDELNQDYSELLNILKNKTKDIGSGTIGHTDYDLSEDIKNNINSKIEEIYENINNNLIEIKSYKNDELELLGWENLVLCYDSVNLNLFDKIVENFNTFMLIKKKYEKTNINQNIKNIIRMNFNTAMDNFISTFGNEFFQRIINYNENFKITSLYQNLKYSLVISLSYYNYLKNIEENINALTNDLKIKLYKLNNLNEIAEKENNYVLKILSDKADDFIEKSKQHIIKIYKTFLSSDTSIQLKFNERIQKCLNEIIKDVSPDLEQDYSSLLNEKFKKKLINSYKNTMNKQTNDLIQTVNDLKEEIKILFDDLFSLDIESTLNKTNYQMNITLNSIEEYKKHFDSFKLPIELIDFILDYGNNIIKPSYEDLENLINKETKNLTFNNIEKKSQEFEISFNKEEIIGKIDIIYSLIDNNNNNILREIDLYGINEYPNVLNNEINRIERRLLRRLNDEQTKEDEIEEYRERIADKSIDENFHKLLNISKNTKNFVQSFEYFDKFVEIIDKNKKKLSLSYKKSQQIINDAYQENEQEEDVFQTVNYRLNNLFNLSLNYYDEIKDSFISLKNYSQNTLNEIDHLLNECANITYRTFADKYEEISKEANTFDNSHYKIEEDDLPIITHFSNHQNNDIITDGTLIKLIKKARFKFSLILEGEEGDIKKPKILAIVNNEIVPKKIDFKISSLIGDCGEDYQNVEVEFNKVNYTIILNFDTTSTLINVTTITDFDAYDYKVSRYKMEDELNTICVNILDINSCSTRCQSQNPITIDSPRMKKQKRVYEEIERFFIDKE